MARRGVRFETDVSVVYVVEIYKGSFPDHEILASMFAEINEHVLSLTRIKDVDEVPSLERLNLVMGTAREWLAVQVNNLFLTKDSCLASEIEIQDLHTSVICGEISVLFRRTYRHVDNKIHNHGYKIIIRSPTPWAKLLTASLIDKGMSEASAGLQRLTPRVSV